MTAKEKIFAAFGDNVTEPGNLSYAVPLQRCEDRTASFIETATRAGSECRQISSVDEVRVWVENAAPSGSIISKVAPVPGNLSHDFDDEFDFLVVRAATGIAENGSVWLDDALVPERKSLFFCKHLVIVLNEADIVTDLMEADIKSRSLKVGYGVLISGPSKTADIEQSLVMGAQGPISCHLFILRSGSL
jgi:L-lactate dehydrogenase complex protein LldG